jgi:hypothetical protein
MLTWLRRYKYISCVCINARAIRFARRMKRVTRPTSETPFAKPRGLGKGLPWTRKNGERWGRGRRELPFARERASAPAKHSAAQSERLGCLVRLSRIKGWEYFSSATIRRSRRRERRQNRDKRPIDVFAYQTFGSLSRCFPRASAARPRGIARYARGARFIFLAA